MTTKYFIVGLPRTGTTSVCSALLELGYFVAHTAYTEQAFSKAQVIADTPVFADFIELDKFYPDSKFIYLNRCLDQWLPSIRQLLLRMHNNLMRDDGGFNPTIKRCYKQVFSPFTQTNIHSDEFLQHCYARHQQYVFEYFSERPEDLLTIDVSVKQDFTNLINYLSVESEKQSFDRLNTGGKVTAWKDISSPFKVASTIDGKPNTAKYYQRAMQTT